MLKPSEIAAVRESARLFEASLPPAQRKQLGQFFSGTKLGRLLAHLSLSEQTCSVLDPMAGHGDLLDSAYQAAHEMGTTIGRLDGIEIEPATAQACAIRLQAIASPKTATQVVCGSAFSAATIASLPAPAYDLVITNPPYVRYQRTNSDAENVRTGIQTIVAQHAGAQPPAIWLELAKGYSGLSDLSVPAWILAATLVRPGGRLALVAPSTWRTREYASVIRYLLLRFFSVEVIVEDTQPGWFSDALVRTQLIVATRLSDDQARQPVGRRPPSSAHWVHISPRAASADSLMGAAFPGSHPELQFATWLNEGHKTAPVGIEVRAFDLRTEWNEVCARAAKQPWLSRLEQSDAQLPLFAANAEASIPDALRQLLPAQARPKTLIPLEQAGIQVGQGLRTGCNSFFYVEALSEPEPGFTAVKTSHSLGGEELLVPSEALRPVLRRQAEVADVIAGNLPSGRALVLKDFLLPEEVASWPIGTAASRLKTMPEDLANFVRRAGTTVLPGSSAPVSALSAVRTNARNSKDGSPSRYWYMLPDFAQRHLPSAFVARINHGLPWVECNQDPPLLIDANFSTIWASSAWTPFAIKALLNSIWCRTYMEILGTPLGGGALKLEAAHLRQILVPRLSGETIASLHMAGAALTRHDASLQSRIDTLVLAALIQQDAADQSVELFARAIQTQADVMRSSRQRVA